MASAMFAPGILVRHPERPDWGTGQIQSVDGSRVTVGFENVGLMVINTERVALRRLGEDASRA